MNFLNLFVATAWDIYFVFGKQSGYYLLPKKLNDDIIMYIGNFIVNHGYEIPNLSSMVNELAQIDLNLNNFSHCDQKDIFVIKYSTILQRNLTKNINIFMYSEKLESIIDAIVEDGSLDESSLTVLKNAAIKESEDPDEVLIIVKGRIAKAKKTVTSAQPATVQSNKIGGPARKCPACGADYIPGTAICPECGYVFSGIGASSSAEKLYNRLQEFNNHNKTKSDGGMMSSLLKMYNMADDGTSDIARRKMDVIQSFPVPNNREDLFDFITSLQPKADINGPKTGVKGGGIPGTAIGKQKTEDLSYAYWLLFSNCINKAKISFANDKDFAPFFEYYDKLTSSSKGVFSMFKKK